MGMSSYRRTHRTTPSEPDKPDAVIYLRVSTTRQAGTAIDIDRDGLSIATQREACNTKAREKGKVIVSEFVEPGKSAGSISKRPIFRSMLAYVAEHPNVGAIIVYSQSRAFRNAHDFITTKYALKNLGVRLISTKEDFGDSEDADFIELVNAGVDEMQIKKSGRDIKTKMAYKARSGGTIGTAPIGYLNTRVIVDGRQIAGVIVDEERAPLIRLAFELYATGDYTFEGLAETMEEHGLRARPTNRWPASRPVTTSTMVRILGDPYYAGFTIYDNQLYPGRHSAIVDQALFDRVQDVLDLRSQPGKRERTLKHYLKGMLHCGRCHSAGRTGRLVYTEAKGNGGTYAYFLCRGRQRGECDLPHLPALLVENKIIDHYAHLRLHPDYQTQFQAALDEALIDQHATTRELDANLRREQQRLSTQEDVLIDALADGRLSTDKLNQRITELRRKQHLLDNRIRESSQELDSAAALIKTALDMCSDPHRFYNDATDEARGHINRAFYEVLYIDEHGDVTDSQMTQPFLELHETHRHWLDLTNDDNRARNRRSAGLTNTPHPQRKQRSVIHEALLRNQSPGPNHGIDYVNGSSKAIMVELRGFEPLTFSLRTRRATNCATAPDCVVRREQKR
jgi:site-specific DNA recombinase